MFSDCHACARLMAEADEENSVVFSALERELNTLVPTQRLWTRINESIEVEKSHAPLWQKVLAYVCACQSREPVDRGCGRNHFGLWNVRYALDAE
jgi:hypothetical protein